MPVTETRPAASPPEGPARPVGQGGVSARAVGLGLALIPLLIFWLEYTEIVASGPDLAAMSLPMGVLFALLVLVGVNLVVKRVRPQAALSQGELLTVYAMNAVAVPLGGIGMMQFLTPALAGWKHYATRENRWENWHHFLPPWAVPDPAVIPAYYAGRSSLLAPGVLAGWATPISVWTGFLLLLLGCFYCLSALIRRQWVDRERLPFPIVQIPLEMTRNGGDTPLWRSPLLWGGAGIAAGAVERAHAGGEEVDDAAPYRIFAGVAHHVGAQEAVGLEPGREVVGRHRITGRGRKALARHAVARRHALQDGADRRRQDAGPVGRGARTCPKTDGGKTTS